MNTTRRDFLTVTTALLGAGGSSWTLAQGRGGDAPAPLPASASASTSTTPGVTQGVWHDEQRNRDVPWRLRLPAGDGRVPLIVFSHGLGGSLDGGTEWAQTWAAAGLATLHIQHAGSDRAIWAGGLRGVKAAASVEQLVARCHDVRFAVAQLLQQQRSGAAGWARVRPELLGMSGHSFGAQTTLAVAGRAFPIALGADLIEPAFKAFAAFSPSAGMSADGMKAITRPMLCLTGSLDGNPLGQERSGTYRRAVYDALPPGAKAQLWLEGADHMTFGGGGERGAGFGARLVGRQREQAPQTMAAHHAAVIKTVSTDWWRARLLDDAAAVAELRSPPGLGRGDEWQQG